ncbi:MAG: beta-lactamase family protein, partial [Verrucomicrobia bacterium]|nr:beta-lactamase family protein [Cytophagales bacterium]
FMPGDEHAYTNINFILLGEIVRKVSGMSLKDFADKHIFQPLQMKNTYFNDNTTKITPDRAIAYRYKEKNKQFKKTKLSDKGIVGDHNLITTVDDLMSWQQNFYQNRLGKQSPELVEKMQTRFVLNNGDTTHYGFGLVVTLYKNRWQTVSHGGDDERYTSFIIRFPQQRLSIVCLSNIARYNDTETKAFGIADVFLNISPVKKDSTKIQYTFSDYEKAYFEDKTGDYTGISKKNAFWFHQIQVVDNKPYWSFGGNQKLRKEMRHIGNQHFAVMIDEPDAFLEVWFSKMPDGTIQLHEKFRNDTLNFIKKPVANISEKELRKFRGEYINEEIGGTMKVKVKKGNLVFSKGIIKIKTIAVSPDTFYAPDNRAFFRFQNGTSSFLIDAIDFRNFSFSKAATQKTANVK